MSFLAYPVNLIALAKGFPGEIFAMVIRTLYGRTDSLINKILRRTDRRLDGLVYRHFGRQTFWQTDILADRHILVAY